MFRKVDINNNVRSAPLRLVQALRTSEINKYAWPEEYVWKHGFCSNCFKEPAGSRVKDFFLIDLFRPAFSFHFPAFVEAAFQDFSSALYSPVYFLLSI